MGWIRQRITLNVCLDETKATSANWKLWLVAAEATVFLRCQDPGEKAPIASCLSIPVVYTFPYTPYTPCTLFRLLQPSPLACSKHGKPIW